MVKSNGKYNGKKWFYSSINTNYGLGWVVTFTFPKLFSRNRTKSFFPPKGLDLTAAESST